MRSSEKILSRTEAGRRIREYRKQGKIVVFTNGCFDILHAGHVRLLEAAREFGDILVVGLNSDASVRRLKGDWRPFNSQNDRALMLAGLQSVDYVVLFNEDTPREILAELKPQVLVKGGDYACDEIIGRELVETVKIIPLIEGYSSTTLIERIKRANPQTT